MTSGGTGATYRGFRRQALYALLRVLSSTHEDRRFIPEDIEDLAIYDSRDHLIELVQVKSASTPLNLSDLGYHKPGGFFSRAATNLALDHPPEIKVVVFGTLGSELVSISDGAPDYIERAAKKISEVGYIRPEQARLILEKCEFVQIEEGDVQRELNEIVLGLDYAMDVPVVMNFLIWKMFSASEHRELLTRDSVIQSILAVGKFISERSAKWDEWFVTILPLQDREISLEERSRLKREFQAGVSVTFDHILADLGIQRSELEDSIEAAHDESRIALLIGASGQGKSQTMYQYLYEKVPSISRFVIRNVEGSMHGLRISQAIVAHARALNSPVHVGIEIAPGSRGWSQMIRDLSIEPFVKMIVCVRPEDWRAEGSPELIGKYQEIPIQLSKEDAKYIFDRLESVDETVMSFEDAWHRCGPNPPLLEFVHFCSQQISLGERIGNQVYDLQMQTLNGLDPCVMEMLEIVAASSETESAISFGKLEERFGNQKTCAAIGMLEDEFLIRKASGSAEEITGLHPLRSAYVLESLAIGSDWITRTREVANFVVDENLAQYILFQFDHGRISSQDIDLLANQFNPISTFQVRAMLRVLIWTYLYTYVETQSPLLNQIFEDSNRSWMAILDVDIAGIEPEGMKRISDFAKPDRRVVLEKLRSKQRSKDEVYAGAKRWFAVVSLDQIPIARHESSCISEIGFWSRRMGLSEKFYSWIKASDLFTPLPPYYLELDAPSISMAFESQDAELWRKIQPARHQLLNDMLDAFPGSEFIGEGNILSVNFQMNQKDSESLTTDLGMANSLCMMFVRILRSLCPEYGEYQISIVTTLCGQESPIVRKAISRSNIYPPWGVALNRAFIDFAESRFLPASFVDFIEDVRRAVQSFCRELSNTVVKAKKYYRKHPLGKTLPLTEKERLNIYLAGRELRRLPGFPESGQMVKQVHQLANFDVAYFSSSHKRIDLSHAPVTRDSYRAFLRSAEAVTSDLCVWFGFGEDMTEIDIASRRESISEVLDELIQSATRLYTAWTMELTDPIREERPSPITLVNVASLKEVRDTLISLFSR